MDPSQMKYTMKLKRIFLLPAIAAVAVFSGCNDQGTKASNAILVDDSAIVLPAAETDRTITIYADGEWVADVTETWMNISPNNGIGTVEAILHADYNSAESMRTGQVIIKGSESIKNVTIDVSQKGDRFKNAGEYTVSQLYALESGTLAKVLECQVMALSKTGFVVSDGESSIYVSGYDTAIQVGDKVTLTGDLGTSNGLVSLELEDAVIVSSGEASYPQAEDITDGIADYAPENVEYVTFSGSYSGGKFIVNDKETSAPSNPLDSFEIDNYELHYVTVNGYYVGTSDSKSMFVITSITDDGPVGTVYLGFEIETSAFKSGNPSFGTTYQFAANEGDGYIKYVPYDLANTNANNKFAMDISGNDPRCTGPWPEDYWLFYGEAPIKSGSKVQIKFGARTSATGHKYWILEYLDGKTWKTAGTPLVSTDMPDGQNVTYTHAMNSDGATNVTINETVVFERNVEHGQFRFRCVANWQANGSGSLAARNGGSARLAVASAGNTAPQPTIIILEEGDGSAVDPVPANINVSVNHLSFDGTPSEPKTFTVSADQDYTITSNVSWLTVDETSGAANEEKTVTVTCAPSELSELREGVITILAGETEYEIPVVQGALGQKLDPFISVSTGNFISTSADAAELSVMVQANVEFETTVDSDWLTFAPVVSSRAAVEWTPFSVEVAENTTTEERVGHIFFTNKTENLQSVVTVTQAGRQLIKDEMLAQWSFSAERMVSDGYADTFGTTAGKITSAAGDNGQYLNANEAGTGTIKYIQTDKTSIDVDGKSAYFTGATGQPYMVGAWKGDCWLVTATRSEVIPALSRIRFYAQFKASGTGLKYWIFEYLDGETWKPVTPLESKDDFQYNIELMNTTALVIDETIQTSVAMNTIQFRLTAASVAQASGKGDLAKPNGGTIRFAGAADGTAPFIQLLNVPKSETVYEDGFDWIKPFIEAYNTANPSTPVGDFVGTQYADYSTQNAANAPNVYTKLPDVAAFAAAVAEKGYEDLCPSNQAIYLQDTYLKFGLTKKHTGIRFSPLSSLTAKTDVDLNFDWCAHFTGSGVIDKVHIMAVIEGDGYFAATGTKESPAVASTQQAGEHYWQNVTFCIKGATSSTKIIICSKEGYEASNWQTSSGAYRYHLDNIKILK